MKHTPGYMFFVLGNIIFVLAKPGKVCYNNNKVKNKGQTAAQTEGWMIKSYSLICRGCSSEAKQERGSEQWQDLHYQEICIMERVR
ncbi:hypothetical protein [Fusicatenibacter sp.]